MARSTQRCGDRPRDSEKMNLADYRFANEFPSADEDGICCSCDLVTPRELCSIYSNVPGRIMCRWKKSGSELTTVRS